MCSARSAPRRLGTAMSTAASSVLVGIGAVALDHGDGNRRLAVGLGLGRTRGEPCSGSGRLLAPVLATTAAAARLALDDDRCLSVGRGGRGSVGVGLGRRIVLGVDAVVVGVATARASSASTCVSATASCSTSGATAGASGSPGTWIRVVRRRPGVLDCSVPWASRSRRRSRRPRPRPLAGSATASTSVRLVVGVSPRLHRPRRHRPQRRRRLPACGGDGLHASHGACASSRA